MAKEELIIGMIEIIQALSLWSQITEDAVWIVNEHGMDLAVRHPSRLERRQHVVADMKEVPVRRFLLPSPFRYPVHIASRVVGQYNIFRISLKA